MWYRSLLVESLTFPKAWDPHRCSLWKGPLAILSRAGQRGLWLCSAWLGLSFGPGYGGWLCNRWSKAERCWKDQNVSACVQVFFCRTHLRKCGPRSWKRCLEVLFLQSLNSNRQSRYSKNMYLHYSHKSTDRTGSRFQQERIAYKMALWLLGNYGDSANWVQCTQEARVTRCHRRKTYQTGSGLHTSMLQYSRRNNRFIDQQIPASTMQLGMESANRNGMTMSDHVHPQ